VKVNLNSKQVRVFHTPPAIIHNPHQYRIQLTLYRHYTLHFDLHIVAEQMTEGSNYDYLFKVINCLTIVTAYPNRALIGCPHRRLRCWEIVSFPSFRPGTVLTLLLYLAIVCFQKYFDLRGSSDTIIFLSVRSSLAVYSQ